MSNKKPTQQELELLVKSNGLIKTFNDFIDYKFYDHELYCALSSCQRKGLDIDYMAWPLLQASKTKTAQNKRLAFVANYALKEFLVKHPECEHYFSNVNRKSVNLTKMVDSYYLIHEIGDNFYQTAIDAWKSRLSSAFLSAVDLTDDEKYDKSIIGTDKLKVLTMLAETCLFIK